MKVAQKLITEDTEVRCPSCDSEAVYKYGRTKSGKQRYLCILCGRQFTLGGLSTVVKHRPECPQCGSKMHLYMKKGTTARFRCSRYPKCRTFVKIDMGEEDR